MLQNMNYLTKHHKNIFIAFIAVLSVLVVVLVFAVPAYAITDNSAGGGGSADGYQADPACDDPELDSDCTDPAIECGKSGSGDCGLFDKYLNPIVVFLSAAVGVAVTIGIIIGGIQYASSGGDPGKAAKARDQIRNSIITLVAFLLLWALINWIVPGGLN